MVAETKIHAHHAPQVRVKVHAYKSRMKFIPIILNNNHIRIYIILQYKIIILFVSI